MILLIVVGSIVVVLAVIYIMKSKVKAYNNPDLTQQEPGRSIEETLSTTSGMYMTYIAISDGEVSLSEHHTHFFGVSILKT